MNGRIPQSFIDEVITRSDIVEIVDARVPLKKSGNNYSTRCPFHEEKTPSFTVSPNKQFYYCFGCGAGGNVIGFLMAYDHLDFVDAITYLANQHSMQVPNEKPSPQDQHQYLYALLEQISSFYQAQLKNNQNAISYLKQRGLTGTIAKQFGLGFAPSGWDTLIKHFHHQPELRQHLKKLGLVIQKEDGNFYDRFRDRIMFPIKDRRGRIIGFGGRALGDGTPKYLNSPETVLFHKGKELYGLYEARKATRQLNNLIIVEGYMDLIAMFQHGFTNVVATLGTATTTEHLQLLFRTTSEIIFCFDGDRAGKAAAWRALETALPLLQDDVQLNFMFLPDGEDPDSLIRKLGTAAFEEQIKNAMPLSEFFFSNIASHLDVNTIESKARLAKPTSQLLSKIPPGVFRSSMFERLAKIVRIDSQELQKLAGLKPVAPIPKESSFRKTTSKKLPKPLSTIDLALALLLQNPSLVQLIDDTSMLSNFINRKIELLIQLIKLLKQQPHLNTGALLEYWRDQPESQFLCQLAMWQHNIPEQGIKSEFQGALQGIAHLGCEQKIEMLLAKANQEGLSSKEKSELQNLILKNKTS